MVLAITAPITTQRLLLRPFVADDVEAVHAYLSDPEVVRYLYWEALPREKVRDLLDARRRMTGWRSDGDRVYLAVVRQSDDRLMGDVMLHLRSEEHRQAEIGFSFNPEFSGQGYATEAATAMLDLAFASGDVHRVFGSCDARNVASAALMRRLGMREEAHFRHNEIFKGEWGDELYFAILEDEWRDRRGG